MRRIAYISRMRLESNKANVYNTTKTCEALVLSGAALTLVTSDDGGVGQKENAYFEKHAVRTRFTLVSLRGLSNHFKYGGSYESSVLEVVFSNLALIRWMLWHAKGYDVVYFRDYLLLPIVPLARLLGKPIFFEAHAVMVGRRNKAMGDWIARHTTGVIAITHALGEYYRVLNPNILVSYCAAAEPERFVAVTKTKETLRTDFGIAPDRYVLVYTGNLTRTGNNDSYGLEYIIRALPLMPADTLFVAVGRKHEGETRELEELASSLGVSDKLRFEPWVGKDTVAEYLLAGDVLLIPPAGGRIGNAPSKIFDYLVSGLPIVAAQTTAIGEVLKDGQNAAMVEYANPDSWAKAVTRIRSDAVYAHVLTTQAKKDGSAFTWQNRGTAILSFIEGSNGR